MTSPPSPFIRPLPAPITAHSVDWPIVHYGEITAIHFTLDDSEIENPGWGRITFDKFDALRVCRGEYAPYEIRSSQENPASWIGVVEHSPWLLERYAYEKKYYGTSYGFGGDVNEMLRDFSHYVFLFHDQFVEVLCDGLWFETSPHCLEGRALEPDHPSRHLPESTIVDRFTAHGITCQIRKNPRPLDDLLAHAAYGAQKCFQFAPELDGNAHPSWTLVLRVRQDKLCVTLEGFGRNVDQQYENIPDLASIRKRIEIWLHEVHERRKHLQNSSR